MDAKNVRSSKNSLIIFQSYKKLDFLISTHSILNSNKLPRYELIVLDFCAVDFYWFNSFSFLLIAQAFF